MLIARSLAALAAIGLLAAGPSAWAEDSPSQKAEAQAAPADPAADKKPSPEEVAAARATADRVIARFRVEDLFDNVTGDDGVPKGRHRLSGLVCTLDDSTPYEGITVFPQPLARGEDVGCNSELAGMRETLYATRYPQRPTAEQVVADSVVAMRQSFKGLKPFKGTGVSATKDEPGFPKPVTARFVGKLDGRTMYTRTSAVVIGDWVYAQRVTGPEDQAMMIDLLAEIELLMMIQAVVDNPPTPDAAAIAS
jgi:hypothetical protein